MSLALFLPLLAWAGDGNLQFAQVMNRKPDLEHGAALFAQCTRCHGGGGAGTTDGAVPRIAGQHFPVLVKQLVDFRNGRRRDFRMEDLAQHQHLRDAQDIADVAAYVNGLDSGGTPGTGDGSRSTAGALLFGARCASCHGADGRGNAATAVPRLAGQHYGYLVRQMYDAVDQRRSTLVEIHASKIEPLDYDQVRGIADYLSRIVPPPVPRSP
jgi:cytochrome c553